LSHKLHRWPLYVFISGFHFKLYAVTVTKWPFESEGETGLLRKGGQIVPQIMLVFSWFCCAVNPEKNKDPIRRNETNNTFAPPDFWFYSAVNPE